MSFSPFSFRALLCYGALFLSTGAQAASADLRQALAQRDWDQAITLGQQLSGAEIETAALAPAQSGVVPAMWLMGQARYLMGDTQGASNWVYQAFLGTRLDLATCRDRRTDGVLSVWTQSFGDAVLAARLDVAIRTQAIVRAARYYEHLPEPDALTGWSCRQAVTKGYVRAGNDFSLFNDRSQWKAAQTRAFAAFCRGAGLPLNRIDTFSMSASDVPFSSP